MAGSIIDRRLRLLEGHVASRPGRRQVFRFIDDPEGVERCRRENPDVLIIHRVIVDSPARKSTGINQ